MTIDRSVLEAIELQDTDVLLRAVDQYCKGRQWDSLLELRSRCQEAVTRGRQLWGIEENIRYRLALEAPPSWAGPAVTEGPTRFTLGPLAEVAASTKTWDEIQPHLEQGPSRSTVAAERVIRGDVVEGEIPDLPGSIQPWEPTYPTATYKPDKVETPPPPLAHLEPSELPGAGHIVDDLDSEAALSDLVAPWTAESNGRSQVVTVEGNALAAISALGLGHARTGRLDPSSALAWMAWAGASGGAHGRRRGAAAGRYGAWWVVATLADLEWSPDPDQVGYALGRMGCYWFDDGAPGTGWELRIAIEDPDSGLAWAISAVDQAD